MADDSERGSGADVFGLGRFIGEEIQRTVESGEPPVRVEHVHTVDEEALESVTVDHTFDPQGLDVGALLPSGSRRRLEVVAICFLVAVVALGTLTPVQPTVQVAAATTVAVVTNAIYRSVGG